MVDKIDTLARKIISLEMRVASLENLIKSDEKPISKKPLENRIKQKIDDIGIQSLIIISLKLKSKQSRSEIKSNLSVIS